MRTAFFLTLCASLAAASVMPGAEKGARPVENSNRDDRTGPVALNKSLPPPIGTDYWVPVARSGKTQLATANVSPAGFVSTSNLSPYKPPIGNVSAAPVGHSEERDHLAITHDDIARMKAMGIGGSQSSEQGSTSADAGT